jgi:spermidine synthase
VVDGATLVADTSRGRTAIVLAIAGVGVSSIVAQLSLMREMLGTFAGNEMVLGVILGNWLLLTGLGAFLGRSAHRLRKPNSIFIGAQMLLAVLPLVQLFLLRTLRDVVFTRGQVIGPAETVAASFVLLWPYCLVSGYILTLACEVLARQGDSRGTGRVYLADSLGSIVGGAVFSFVLIRLFDHLGILYIPAMLNLLLAGAVALCLGRKAWAGVAGVALAGLVALAAATDLDDVSTSLQYPCQRILFRGNSPYGRLVVTDSAGQINFIENGLPIISTNNVQQVEEAVHYAMAQRPAARRVLVVAGGVSGTAKEILKYGAGEVVYVELDPLIIDVGRRFIPEGLDDRRIRVVNTDGRQFLRQAERSYDVIIVDVPDPSTSQINRFYTAEFFRDAKRRLAAGGVLSLAVGRYENYVSPELARMLASTNKTLRRSFKNVLAIPGGRVFFLASDGELHQDVAARIEQAGVSTRLMNHHYLDAMLSADRMTDLARVMTRSAATNEDFSPVLYYYHLLYWMSQFKVSFGLMEAMLLALLAIYLVRIRPVPLAIFASGFAASSLEVVLLLAFQVLCGSVYRQLGVIVTLFMVGLAAGAFLANHRVWAAPRRDLARLALALAAMGGLIPLALTGLARVTGWLASTAGVETAIGAMTFAVAGLVGMQFPLASLAERADGALTASRLYTADFVGACLGALLASTLLIPLLGVAAVCALAAGLNVAAAAIVLLRKA